MRDIFHLVVEPTLPVCHRQHVEATKVHPSHPSDTPHHPFILLWSVLFCSLFSRNGTSSKQHESQTHTIDKTPQKKDIFQNTTTTTTTTTATTRPLSQRIKQSTMKPITGIANSVFFGFFLSHIFATILIDSQAVLPLAWIPGPLQSFLAWYVDFMNDPVSVVLCCRQQRMILFF